MTRINQVLGTPAPLPSSAGASGTRSAAPASPARTVPKATTLRSRLAESSEDDLEVPVNLEKKARRLVHHWKRLTGKVIFMIATATRSAVEKHWEQRGLMKDQTPQEALATQPLPLASGKTRRRDDLTGIGAPIPPTQKAYPISRAVCQHVHPETGEQSLQAAGGARLENGERVPFYTWVCLRCGARWQRIPAEHSQPGPPQTLAPPQAAAAELPRQTSGYQALAPAAGSRPDVPIKTEGRMRPSVEARQISGVQTPDVMMIHSDGENDL